MFRKNTLFAGLSLLLVLSQCTNPQPAPKQEATQNMLTDAEKAEGWQSLFDGKSLKGWHNYGKTTTGKSWVIAEEAIHLASKKKADGSFQAEEGGDILTDGEYENFEIQLEWKIAPCGNSGIIYNVVEDPANYEFPWMTGPEMQVLDNACHPDAKIDKHRAGDLYDMIAANPVNVKPAGEWNSVRLVSNKGKVEHWQNGAQVVTYDRNDPNWPTMIAASKFKVYPGFGKASKGRICLQDHGDQVWYRNIKIKSL